MEQKYTDVEYRDVADILERLRNGESVELGEFGDQSVSTDADAHAAILDGIILSLRRAAGRGT